MRGTQHTNIERQHTNMHIYTRMIVNHDFARLHDMRIRGTEWRGANAHMSAGSRVLACVHSSDQTHNLYARGNSELRACISIYMECRTRAAGVHDDFQCEGKGF